MYKLIVHKGVKQWIAKDAANFIRYLGSRMPLRNVTSIELCPAPAVGVECDPDQFGFGLTIITPRNRCKIAIACDWLPWRADGIATRDDARRVIFESLAHEWCHAEQVSRGVRPHHCGVEIKARRFAEEYLQGKVRKERE